MNTNNNPTPSGIAQAMPDTNPSRSGKYLVHLGWTHTEYFYLTVTANSIDDAWDKAKAFDPACGVIDIGRVDRIEEGKNHD